MMNWKRYIPLAFAVIFAMLSSVSVYYFLKDRTGVSHAAPTAPASVVVAKHALPLGKKLTEEDLKIISWPEDVMPEGSFRSPRSLVGKIVKGRIIENEPILLTKLMGKGENFSSLIPSNMRGMTVPLRHSEALAEILDRDTVVDVISVIENKGGVPTTKVIAQNIRVLAVHKDPLGVGSKGPPKNMEVTLIVTPRQAEWLVTAMNEGTIQLAVRNAQERSTESVEWIG